MLTRIAPDLRRRELRHDPLGVVRRPDADAVARRDAEREQRPGAALDLRVELGVASSGCAWWRDTSASAPCARRRPRPDVCPIVSPAQRHIRRAVRVRGDAPCSQPAGRWPIHNLIPLACRPPAACREKALANAGRSSTVHWTCRAGRRPDARLRCGARRRPRTLNHARTLRCPRPGRCRQADLAEVFAVEVVSADGDPDLLAHVSALEARCRAVVAQDGQEIGSVGSKSAAGMGVDQLGALYAAIDIVRRSSTISISGVYGGMADPLPRFSFSTSRRNSGWGRRMSGTGYRDVLPLSCEMVTRFIPGGSRATTCRLPRRPRHTRSSRRRRTGSSRCCWEP